MPRGPLVHGLVQWGTGDWRRGRGPARGAERCFRRAPRWSRRTAPPPVGRAQIAHQHLVPNMSGVSIPIPYMQASGSGIAWGTSAGGCRGRSRRVCPIWLICSLTSCRRVSDPPAPSARRWNSSAQTARTGEGTWHPPQIRRHAGGRPAPTPQPHRLRTLACHNNSSPAGSGEVTTGGSRLKLRSQVRRPWWKVVCRSWGGERRDRRHGGWCYGRSAAIKPGAFGAPLRGRGQGTETLAQLGGFPP